MENRGRGEQVTERGEAAAAAKELLKWCIPPMIRLQSVECSSRSNNKNQVKRVYHKYTQSISLPSYELFLVWFEWKAVGKLGHFLAISYRRLALPCLQSCQTFFFTAETQWGYRPPGYFFYSLIIFTTTCEIYLSSRLTRISDEIDTNIQLYGQGKTAVLDVYMWSWNTVNPTTHTVAVLNSGFYNFFVAFSPSVYKAPACWELSLSCEQRPSCYFTHSQNLSLLSRRWYTKGVRKKSRTDQVELTGRETFGLCMCRRLPTFWEERNFLKDSVILCRM